MEANKDGKNGQTEDTRGSKGSQLESKPGCLGVISISSGKFGTHQVGASREDSYEPNTFISRELTGSEISGKIAGQLLEETEKQLAYHEQQAEILKERVQVLRQIAEVSNSH